MEKPSICFVGLENLPVLAREFNRHGIGGEQVQQTLLAKALQRRGYQVSMVVGDYGQPDEFTRDGVKIFKAFRFDAGLPGFRFIHPRWTGVWSALRRAAANVYYLSCADMRLGQLAVYGKFHRCRLIFRIAHDTDCEPDKLLVPYRRDRLLYEYGLRRTDIILAQSEAQRKAMRNHYGLDSQLATMLVDQPSTHRSFTERDIRVLWVNNLRAFKRPDLFVELAKSLPALGMHMVGGPQPGFQALFDEIREHARTMSNLTFHGQTPYHEVGDFYERARVFVNTSDSEGFPNSYLQAWIRGTPVIAFFDPDGVIAREGLGIAVRSIEEMAAAVKSLADDPDRWGVMSSRCRRYMEREYSEQKILQPYICAIEGSTGRLAHRPAGGAAST
ncbi:MAG: glycosyltransferase family 4 protein [Pseudomonadota bacterium]|nr:glycosyltransferase family 4 protein [Pseudomonadota bacterium]